MGKPPAISTQFLEILDHFNVPTLINDTDINLSRYFFIQLTINYRNVFSKASKKNILFSDKNTKVDKLRNIKLVNRFEI